MAKRTLNIRIAGEGFFKDRVPLTILASKLEALQTLVYHATATVRRDKAARRGPWFNRYRSVAELTFVGSHHSELVVEAELAESEALTPEMDTGYQAIDLIFQTGEALGSSFEEVSKVIPDPSDRVFMLRSLENLCPDPLDGYQVTLENGSTSHKPITLTGKLRQEVRQWITSLTAPTYEDREPETLVGTLTKIHVEVAPLKIAVQLSSGVEVDCFYEESLRDQVANLLAGSTVEVTGIVTRDMEGRVRQIDRILDIETVGTEPLRLHRIGEVGLKIPILFSVEYVDGLWIYRNEELNLWGRGCRREEALKDLSDNFEYLWNEIALEEDAKLENKAVELKKKLLNLAGESYAAGR